MIRDHGTVVYLCRARRAHVTYLAGRSCSQCRYVESLAYPRHQDKSRQDTPSQDSDFSDAVAETGRAPFVDRALITLRAGAGGHGCISFLREKYLEYGPANGGDGGTGGSIYIQAVKGETSLLKLARRSIIKAERGQNGKGKSKGGQRGEDVLIQVPVGTIIKEVSRVDPSKDEQRKSEQSKEDSEAGPVKGTWRRDRWILYAGASAADYANVEFPRLPVNRRSHLAPVQPGAPIFMDLEKPMDTPLLLAAGGVGGCGNPHFLSPSRPRPKFATKGEPGITVTLELELKLLADLGFVGMPNAGKSTLLRALSRSRARVGDWAFTTLSPNIGTMVLDDSRGSSFIKSNTGADAPRTHVSVADIPGLITDAHLDKGLGLGFLRHIERARILAFVIDLSLGDAVGQLKVLWKELSEFERLRSKEEDAESSSAVSTGIAGGNLDETSGNVIVIPEPTPEPVESPIAPISGKPWFVVANKADLANTQENFLCLQRYLDDISEGKVDHPCEISKTWKGHLIAIPVSAIQGEGVEQIRQWTVELLS